MSLTLIIFLRILKCDSVEKRILKQTQALCYDFFAIYYRAFPFLSIFSLYESKGKLLTSAEIENSFASNICRCTGYRSIADAFKSFAKDAPSNIIEKVIDLEDIANTCMKSVKCELIEICDNGWCIIGPDANIKLEIDCDGHKWFRAQELDDIFKAMKNGDYRLVAGNTGQGNFLNIKLKK